MTDHHDGDDYEVGYGKPPKEHQWKKGQSGNPKGRPPDSRNLKRVLREVVTETTEVIVNGEPVTMSVQEAMMRRLVMKALKGDRFAMRLFVEISGRSPQRFEYHGE